MKILKLCNSNILPRLNYNQILRLHVRNNSTQPQPSEAVVLTKSLENPILVVPEQLKLDAIALASRVASLRPKVNKVTVTQECSQHTAELLPEYDQSDTRTTVHVDMIGPPNPISKLRPIIRYQRINETYLQRKLRMFQDETQAWNEKFWSEHNSKFNSERDSFIKERLKNEDRQTLTSEEMSEFYKDFLDRTWKSHINYNFAWYKRNFYLVFMELLVNLDFRRSS